MTIYDLHVHSTASDGSYTPAEVMSLAAQKNIDYIALTDHDTTAGVACALENVSANLKLLPGVEISVTWHGHTIHILGLGINIATSELQQGLAKLCEFRVWRAEEMARLLDLAGIPDLLSSAQALAQGGLISRTHFAKALVDKGYAKDMRQVFKRYLVPGKPGYVRGQWASLEQAIAWILAADGMPVIAHPAKYGLSAGKLAELITAFKDFGGLALEVVSGSHSDKDCFNIAGYCKRYELFASTGSDFHGEHMPWRHLGKVRALPDGVEPLWEQAIWHHCLENVG